MACRLDLYAEGTDRPAGFASAADADEERLTALLVTIADRTALGPAAQGHGALDPAEVEALEAELHEVVAACPADLERSWAEALRRAAASIATTGGAAHWLLRYDTGGSLDDGPDEFPTAWSS